ncbi:MAG TPA: TIM-barrel domain-containing protein [Gemmataceae bacterium]|nr:TIM-barrel domain-containing protein [Gemmataceae bacterium]
MKYSHSQSLALAIVLMASPQCWGRQDAKSLSGEIFQSQFDTSSPAIAPPWSMKPWFWEDDVNTAEAVWDLVNGCREHELPLGAVLIDSPWATAYNNFRFDEKRYPNPRAMIDALHAKGIRVVLWMTNVVNTTKDRSDAPGDGEDLYAIGKAKGYFVNHGTPVRWWKGRGGMIDYTNPEALAWWHRLMDRALSLGIDGWKVDGAAELFILTPRQTSRGVLSLRDYVDLYYRDTLHYGRLSRADFVTMVRSVDIANSQGSDQPHAPFDAAPLTWVGDQRHSWNDKGMDEAVRSAFRAMERGYPLVSSDTGGYQTATKHVRGMPRTLFLRWAQWNALTPFFLNGGHDEHRPWKFDPEFLRIFRRHMWLHSELIPFFYAQHVQASLREGKLMHVGPGKHEFLLGDALLVAVMTGEEQNRVVTFPEGTWLDYWDNKLEYRGGQQVSVAVPEERSPVFVRLGSIIPLDVQNDAVNHGSAASKGWRTLDIYPAKEASQATLWDTASFPPNLQRDRTLVYLTPIDNEMEVRLEGGASRDTILRIRRFSAPTSVEADGKLLERRPNRASWEADRQGWWYDGDDRRLWIRLANARSSRVH